ncbi:MAG: hypothetical protein H6830_06780 [Planctomycetes bacterium]|nr:hypothetical protein [Planctomycetota bacterium]MCB9911163.1 hypothetical protein [Planctomycetota bacterium]MCB9911521.1 hypothetical protein [Planctomycetota bacterium]HPF12772.1 hypothetical protein [Planctomycetota bacterium]
MPDNVYSPPASPAPRPSSSESFEGSGTFSIGQCFSDGWNKTLANIGLILIAGLVSTLVMVLAGITIIGYFLVVPVMTWGMVRFALNLHDGCAQFGDIFSGFTNYGDKLLKSAALFLLLLAISLPANAVYYLGALNHNTSMIVVGYVIMVVFGLVVMTRLYFAFVFMVDRNMGAQDSIKASWNMTGPIWGPTVLLAFVSGLVSMAGVLALVVGLLVSIPVSYLMWISAYRQAVGKP